MVLLVGGAYSYMAGRRDTARAAADEVAECRSLLSRIETLRQQPSGKPGGGRSQGELIGQITEAAAAAGFGEDTLDRIEPQGVRSQGEGKIAVEQTRVYLKKVTLQQAVVFLHALDSSGASTVSHLRFLGSGGAKPGGATATGGGPNTWAVEATLSRSVSTAQPEDGPTAAGE